MLDKITKNELNGQADSRSPATGRPQYSFRTLWQLGYKALLPIVPPGSIPSTKSYLHKSLKSIGKAPGIRNADGTWSGVKGWQKRETTEADLDTWQAMEAGVGLRCGDDGILAIDADALSIDHARTIRRIVEDTLGDLPARVGRHPKALYVCRVIGEIDRSSIKFGDADDKVEFLSEGRQFVAWGIHPGERKPYIWHRELPPLDQLPLFEASRIATLKEELKAALPKARMLKNGVNRGSGAPPPQEMLEGERDLVERAVAAIPNSADRDRDVYIQMLCAIKASLPDDEDVALTLALDWCERWEGVGSDGKGNDPDTVVKDWISLTPPFRRGARHLYAEADKYRTSNEPSLTGLRLFTILPDEEPSPFQAAADVDAGDEWPEPLDIFGHEDPASLSEPPQGALPETLGRWARSEARRKGVPPTFAAASAMTAVAAAIGGSLRIRPRVHDDGWTEPAAFWTALVADPGSAKSPTISAAVQPLRELDKERWRLDKPRHDEWLAATRRRGKDAPPPGPEPAIRRCVVDDITMEQQVRIHAANPRGLLRAPDELAGLLGSLGAYKKGADADRSQLLRLFDGGEITIDRVGSGTTRADSALMTVLAGTQPDKIRYLTRDLGADGLLQRCFFVLDDGVDRIGIDEPADAQALADYRQLVRYLAQAEHLPLSVVRASPEAQAALVDAWRRISALAHLPGASGALQGHIAKWEKLLWRIALVFHCVNEFGRAGGVDCEVPLSLETARQAALFAGHLVQHSIEFYRRNYDASTTNTEAIGIAGWLLTRPDISTVTRRDIQQARKSLAGADNVRQLLRAMEELVIAGWCKEEARKVDGPTKWAINPAVHERFFGQAQREKEERKRKHELIKDAGAARRALAGAFDLNSARDLNEGAFA